MRDPDDAGKWLKPLSKKDQEEIITAYISGRRLGCPMMYWNNAEYLRLIFPVNELVDT